MSRRLYIFTVALWVFITVCNATAGNWAALVADVAVLFFVNCYRALTRETDRDRAWACWWAARYEELLVQLAAAGVKVTYEGEDDPPTSRRHAGEDNPSQGGTV